MRNSGKLVFRVEALVALSLVFLQSCVNPPQRASGVNPAPAKPPVDQPISDDSGRQTGGGDVTGDRPILPPANAPVGAPPAEKVKVSYWLNPTANSNCLTLQVQGAASPISAPCTGVTRPSEVWVDNLFPSTGSSAFKLSAKVETTEKSNTKFESTTDNPGSQAWRWRCFSAQGADASKNVHMLCYEDGNALAKTFESSDLFVQVVGAASVDLGGLQCQKVTAATPEVCNQR
ncbi:MAG: hypothetical protein RI932_149 [Pseudomonadota bacterium]|jgi:hypothetical protein